LNAGAEPQPSEIEREIATLRTDLGELMRELDRRRHEMFDVRVQLRRHLGAFAAVAAAGVLVAFGGYAISSSRRRRAQSPRVRAANLGSALAVLSREDPEDLQRAIRGRPPRTSLAVSVLTRTAALLAPRLLPRRS
jgi:hypothetical protein